MPHVTYQKITVIKEGQNAEACGLQSGDIIIEYDGRVISTPEELSEAIEAARGQVAVAVSIMRDGAPLVVTVAPGALGIVMVPVDGSELASRFTARQRADTLAAMTVTTAEAIEGRQIVQTLGIVSGESVLGMNVFKDVMAALTDVVGGRSGTWQRAVRDASTQALDDLRIAAHERGGNAVIGTRIAYSEIAGGGKSMLLVAAYGTAVMLEDR
jgi:uncharacterized protein YbjQ (UPF0145 family)